MKNKEEDEDGKASLTEEDPISMIFACLQQWVSLTGGRWLTISGEKQASCDREGKTSRERGKKF